MARDEKRAVKEAVVMGSFGFVMFTGASIVVTWLTGDDAFGSHIVYGLVCGTTFGVVRFLFYPNIERRRRR